MFGRHLCTVHGARFYLNEVWAAIVRIASPLLFMVIFFRLLAPGRSWRLLCDPAFYTARGRSSSLPVLSLLLSSSSSSFSLSSLLLLLHVFAFVVVTSSCLVYDSPSKQKVECLLLVASLAATCHQGSTLHKSPVTQHLLHES